MLKVTRYDDNQASKSAFVLCYAFFSIIFMVIMHFVILIMGWGLSVQSWGWMIAFWVSSVIVIMIKDLAVTAINKISEY